MKRFVKEYILKKENCKVCPKFSKLVMMCPKCGNRFKLVRC